eukprot:6208841-Pleurochrysis_carterae.AAC.5
MLQSKPLEAQAEAFKDSLREMAELLQDFSITKIMEPRVLDFVPALIMNNQAAAPAQGSSP